MRWGIAGLIVLCVAASVLPAMADTTVSGAGGQDQVDQLLGKYNLQPAIQKGGRGLANFFGGWLEIPLQIHRRYSTADTAGSFFTGAGHGVLRAIVRTAVGAYEAVTFFLPYPEHFAPILPTLEYFQKDTRREPLPLE